MMRTNGVLVLALALSMAGCATKPQLPVQLADNALGGDKGRIGVVLAEVPKVDTSFPGAYCLLCMAAANVANASLTTHVQKLPTDEWVAVRTALADALRKRGADVVAIEEPLKLDALPDAPKAPNLAPKDHSSLKAKYRVDKLLVVQTSRLGVERPYSSYVPTGGPRAVVRGSGYLVNLSNNTYEWYLPLAAVQAAQGEWDEPPRFPGITNAYFQVLETAKDELVRPFRP